MTGRRLLFVLALLLIPVSHGVKLMLGLKLWIDPTLLLALAIFLLFGIRVRPWPSLMVVMAGFGCAYVGSLFLAPRGSDLQALNRIFQEPVRLALSMVTFWVALAFFEEDRQFSLKWLSVSIISQLLVAGCAALVLIGVLPAPRFIWSFLDIQYHGLSTQIVDVGPLVIPRLAGTFGEPSPFGLFMFSGLIVFSLALLRETHNSKWVRFGFVASLVGTLGSLSQQVLIGLLPFLTGLALARGRKRFTLRAALVIVTCALVPYVVSRLMVQKEEAVLLQGRHAFGSSGGERAFHAEYAYDLLRRGVVPWASGAGPGRYGEYVAETGLLPDTTTPQVALVEWAVGYGALGTVLIMVWLWRVLGSGVRTYGLLLGASAFVALLLANMFQANWMSEAWFLALAYLSAGDDVPGQPGKAQRQTTELKGLMAAQRTPASNPLQPSQKDGRAVAPGPL